jgi:hypothetical protein
MFLVAVVFRSLTTQIDNTWRAASQRLSCNVVFETRRLKTQLAVHPLMKANQLGRFLVLVDPKATAPAPQRDQSVFEASY